MPNTEILRQEISNLTEGVRLLAEKLEVQEDTIARNKRKTFWLSLLSIITVLLSIFLILFGNRISHNQDRIDRIQAAQERAVIVNRDGQCAFINLFLQSEKNIKANPNTTPEQKAEQIRAFEILHKIYEQQLKCELYR